MKAEVHRSEARGKGEYGWLSTRYSFSFADWHDSTRMGVGALRVLNDDRIAPDSGFPPHSHRDMEIITIVTKGAVTHEDSLGNSGMVPAGEVQVMSAGTGVTHAEWNKSKEEPLELFQLWIQSDAAGHAPRYEQRHLPDAENAFRLLVCGDPPRGIDGPLFMHQDAFIYMGKFYELVKHTHRFGDAGRGAYLFVADGSVRVGDIELKRRDAVAISDAMEFTFEAVEPSRLLLIDVPLR
ncbi:pirin family protein [Candidatus Parcubacteria bacterium]|nr:pirin family protein [Candidatus Parcubacteria bacterium]